MRLVIFLLLSGYLPLSIAFAGGDGYTSDFGVPAGTSDYGAGSAGALVGATTESIATDVTSSSAAGSETSSTAGSSTEQTETIVITSERVPGALCKCVAPGASAPSGQEGPGLGELACGDIKTRKYECTITTGFTGFQLIFAEIVRVIVYLVLILGVLAIVGLGIAWAWAGGDDIKMKTKLKHWAMDIIIGLIILFLFRYILTFLAPWIFQ